MLHAAPALPIPSPNREKYLDRRDPNRPPGVAHRPRGAPARARCAGRSPTSPCYISRVRICDVADCERKHHAKGYCSHHYHNKPRPDDAPRSPIVVAAERIAEWAETVPDVTGSAIYSAAMITFLSAYLDKLASTRDVRPADIASLSARCAQFVSTIGKLDATTPADPDGEDPFEAFLTELDTATNG